MSDGPDHITQEDINMICYFLKEKSDITRWSEWKTRKEIITNEFPELVEAINNLEIDEKTLNRIVDNISDKIYKYPEE